MKVRNFAQRAVSFVLSVCFLWGCVSSSNTSPNNKQTAKNSESKRTVFKVGYIEEPSLKSAVYNNANIPNHNIETGKWVTASIYKHLRKSLGNVIKIESHTNAIKCDLIIVPKVVKTEIYPIKSCGGTDYNKKCCGTAEFGIELVVHDFNNKPLISIQETASASKIIQTGLHKKERCGATFQKRTISFNRSYKKSFETALKSAVEKACYQVSNELIVSDKYIAYKKDRQIQNTEPAKLFAQILFQDDLSIIPNNSIDAAERSRIMVDLTNQGEGSAFDVKLEAVVDDANIKIQKQIEVGNIIAGNSKQVSIPIDTGIQLQAGIVSIKIVAKEKRGFDSQPNLIFWGRHQKKIMSKYTWQRMGMWDWTVNFITSATILTWII